MKQVQVDGEALTLQDVEDVVNHFAAVSIKPEAESKIKRSREVVEDLIKGEEPVYGLNTGFGFFSQVRISREDQKELQLNLVRSHASGVGPPFGEEVIRAMILLRANTLAKGFSGVRPIVIKTLIQLLNTGLHPFVPMRGSLGASGDLAPLAHIALALIGEGEAFYRGKYLSAAEALGRACITPLELEAKEGLALINGTPTMSALGTLAVCRSERLSKIADVVAAMSLDALRGSVVPFDPRIQAVRPYPGQAASAENMRRILEGSEINKSHEDCGKVQDSYSLRCIPQVHGAVRRVLRQARETLEIEINSASDNPLVFSEEKEVLSCGNFHGQTIGFAMDSVSAAVATLATMSERRIERLMNPSLSELPAFLSKSEGLHSGFMIAHTTAASMCAEAKTMCYPASVDTIPTSAAKEDHVSLGTISASRAGDVGDAATKVIAIELLCAAQALDHLSPLKPSPACEAVLQKLRERVPPLEEDRPLYRDIALAEQLIVEGDLLRAAEAVMGELA